MFRNTFFSSETVNLTSKHWNKTLKSLKNLICQSAQFNFQCDLKFSAIQFSTISQQATTAEYQTLKKLITCFVFIIRNTQLWFTKPIYRNFFLSFQEEAIHIPNKICIWNQSNMFQSFKDTLGHKFFYLPWKDWGSNFSLPPTTH